MASSNMSQNSDVNFSVGDDGVAIITLDVPDERFNILKESFFPAFTAALDDLENNDTAKAAVIISGKPDSFIAGADINIIQNIGSEEEAAELCRMGHSIMNRIAGSRKPVVAAINGVCLGGGFELALACHARVLSNSDKTMVGLPEVKLGILPGFGGTQRLPRLCSLPAALDMMLTGRNIRAYKAKRMGIANELVAPANLLQAAVQMSLRLVKKPKAKKSNAFSLLSLSTWSKWLLEKNSFGRRIIFDQAGKQLLRKTHGNYPAPVKILDVVRKGLAMSMSAALDNEIQGFAELAVSPECKQLIYIYFAHTNLKKETFVKDKTIKPEKINRVGVLGGGLMGSGIALVSLDKAGSEVRIKDVSDNGLRGASKYVFNYFQTKVKRRSMSAADARRAKNKLTYSLDLTGFSTVDLVVEAVFEDLKLKKQMVKDIQDLGNEKTIFATNTSSIPIKDIVRGSAAPERIIGMHYFSPVEKMPLLEIIKHNRTSESTIVTAVNFGKKQGKTVIVVKDVAGFYVNRILFPYINEAGHLAAEGVPIDAIDKAMVSWGLPVGPFKLLDEVGLDVGLKVQNIIEQAYSDRMQSTDIVQKMLNAERLGKKNKSGFYSYDRKSKGKQIDSSVYSVLGITPNKKMPAIEIALRCILPLLNEAVFCLDEKVIDSSRDGDMGAVFGIGFPPFRGGPFRYIDALGSDVVLAKLKQLESDYGSRFKPADSLAKHAQKGSAYAA